MVTSTMDKQMTQILIIASEETLTKMFHDLKTPSSSHNLFANNMILQKIFLKKI